MDKIKEHVDRKNNDEMNESKKKSYPPFSVTMCVYWKDNPEWFEQAIRSIIVQTVRPHEIVLIVDGLVPLEIENVISKYKKFCSGIIFRVIRFKENKGHGIARRKGVKACSTEIVALMDADDICISTRFEEQLSKMISTNSEIVGGDISEFITNENSIVAYRKVPVSDREIKKFLKKRCPMNQVTVMFRKEAYERAGGYRNWYCEEDYYLWIRMVEKGVIFANTGTILVNVRVGKAMYKRRGGIKYFRSEERLQRYMWKHHFIGFGRYFLNINQRFVMQILLPSNIRGWVFRKFARKEAVE